MPVLPARFSLSFAAEAAVWPVRRGDRWGFNAFAHDISVRKQVEAALAKARDEADKVRRLDGKLARGNSLTHPYAVCTVTVPKTARVSEFGRRLDAAVRRAGFAPLRLDLAQDVAFAASTVPLGVTLTRKAD